MKKTLLALSLIAATGSVTAAELYNQDGSSLTFGGRAEATAFYNGDDVADKSKVRLSFMGKTEINDDLYAVGFYEGEFKTTGDDLDNRYGYAGLGGKYGEITYGKNDGALGMVSDVTDVLSNAGNLAGGVKLASADRQDNMVSYKHVLDHMTVKASYKFDEKENAEDVSAAIGALSNRNISGAIYNASAYDSGLSLGAVIKATENVKIGLGFAHQADTTQLMGSVGATLGNLYVAALFNHLDYSEFGIDLTSTGFDLTGQYTVDKTVFSMNYGSVDADAAINNTDLNGTVEQEVLAFEVAHFFKPTFRAYANYGIDMTDYVNAENTASVGLRYDF